MSQNAWRPRLQEMVDKISKRFGAFMKGTANRASPFIRAGSCWALTTGGGPWVHRVQQRRRDSHRYVACDPVFRRDACRANVVSGVAVSVTPAGEDEDLDNWRIEILVKFRYALRRRDPWACPALGPRPEKTRPWGGPRPAPHWALP